MKISRLVVWEAINLTLARGSRKYTITIAPTESRCSLYVFHAQIAAKSHNSLKRSIYELRICAIWNNSNIFIYYFIIIYNIRNVLSVTILMVNCIKKIKIFFSENFIGTRLNIVLDENLMKSWI